MYSVQTVRATRTLRATHSRDTPGRKGNFTSRPVDGGAWRAPTFKEPRYCLLSVSMELAAASAAVAEELCSTSSPFCSSDLSRPFLRREPTFHASLFLLAVHADSNLAAATLEAY